MARNAYGPRLVAPAASAQDRPVSTDPSFEVVSVKVNLNDDVLSHFSVRQTQHRDTAFPCAR